ncbi:hypothetical protein BDF14DRAFT_1881428 [Spinellus fusiger]|nr:hypothetical protein BDF14DRAFT_1881428 [Spinellus fusiger]
MSRLPTMAVSALPSKSKMAFQPSMIDTRKKDPPTSTYSTHHTTRATRTPSISRASLSSYASQEDDSRYSISSVNSILTNVTSPRTSLTSPKPTPRRPLSRPSEDRPVEYHPTSHSSFRVGDRVAVDCMSIVGTLRFLGATHFKEGTWAGIQLDIVGTGKNDGSVNGARYFHCPSQTGLFVLASKVAPLDRDSDSMRSLSPPSPQRPATTNTTTNNNTINSNNNSNNRASRYIGLATHQLTRTPQRGSLKSMPGRKTSVGMPSPATTPTSTSVQEEEMLSPASVLHPSSSHHHSHHSHPHHPHHSSNSSSTTSSEDDMITDTPVPPNLAQSKSTEPGEPSVLPSLAPSLTPVAVVVPQESPHARLERVLGEAIQQAPDETVVQLQQLQLRVEVLEAENKFLKLENAQNKSAQHILERSLLLRKRGTGDEKDEKDEKNTERATAAAAEEEQKENVEKEPHVTVQEHQAVVEELKATHAQATAAWTSQSEEWEHTHSDLTHRITTLEQEQRELMQERGQCQEQVSESKRLVHQMEHRMHELEQQVALAEATAALQASRTANTTSTFYSQDPEELRERQIQMEMEMEEVHEKVGSLKEAMRAKDMFLANLSEQVESHRNMIEEKEREVRRIKADTDRYQREKERYKEEADELEKRLSEHQECVPREQFDKLKREWGLVKDQLTKESGLVEEYQQRMVGLEGSVDELKKAGMESIELYESAVELHRVDMEAINASLMDERRKVALLEAEREDLRKAGLDAIEAYEATIEEFKKDQSQTP